MNPNVITCFQILLSVSTCATTIWFDKRLRTGHFGCPQTRDRLIFIAAAKGIPLPNQPTPICCDFEKNKVGRCRLNTA